MGSLRTGPAQPSRCDTLIEIFIGLLEFLESRLPFSHPLLLVSYQFIAISYFSFREMVSQSVGLEGSNVGKTCQDW